MLHTSVIQYCANGEANKLCPSLKVKDFFAELFDEIEGNFVSSKNLNEIISSQSSLGDLLLASR